MCEREGVGERESKGRERECACESYTVKSFIFSETAVIIKSFDVATIFWC